MTDTSSYAQAYSDAFSKFVPGFDFLQGLVKNAGHSLPSMGQWIAPVLDPAELERRIAELRTVQFWLEQNARMISATIQAMEVQRMTLSALQGMNVSMADLSEALKIRVPEVFAGAAAAPAPAAAEPPPAAGSDDAPRTEGAAAGAVDPMQWWGALTQQFTQLATQAMQATSEAASQATQAMQAAGVAASETAKAASDAAAEAMAQAQPMAAAAVDTVKAAAEAVVQAVPRPVPTPGARSVRQAGAGATAAPSAARPAAKKTAVAAKKAAPRKAAKPGAGG
ncbi:MAG: hypothetical protein L6Q75_19925 [Burkholderiaceae bacterium]|nr:hypothetical protein [Burkholderiaceae bacterium]